jgi:uncharacterized protein YndB with AHSA1/START domain
MSVTQERASLVITRQLKAAPEKVYAALTQPGALKAWMGPSDGFTVPLAEADVRVGGRYRLIMKSPDGEEHDVGGCYREILPNRKLVFTWAWKNAPEQESLVTVELSATDGGTLLTLRHEQFVDEATRDHHNQGWIGCLTRLERFLEQEQNVAH